jgi:ABC-type glycerol-3-phosphate transport system permease component
MSAATRPAGRRGPLRLLTALLGGLATLALVAFAVFPQLWMLISSFRPATELFVSPPSLLPTGFTLEWYQEAFAGDALKWFANSLIVAAATSLISTTVGALAGYALSRFVYPGRRGFMLLLTSAYLFPAILLLMPLYLMLANYRLVGTLPAIVLAHLVITLPLSTFLMKSFVDSVPRELEEAALVDGCGPIGTFVRVTLPLLRTGLATTVLFSFILSWDEYLFASTLSNGATATVPVGIQTFISSFDVRWGAIMALGTLVTVPVVVLFVFLQRYFEKGITAGSVKG